MALLTKQKLNSLSKNANVHSFDSWQPVFWDKMGILSFPIMKFFRSLVFIEYKDSYKLLLKTYCRNMEKSIKQMFTVAVHNVQYHITLCFFHTRAFINCQTGQGQCYPNPLKAYQQIPCQIETQP